MLIQRLHIQKEKSDLVLLSIFILSMFIPNLLIKNSVIALIGIYGFTLSGSLPRLKNLFINPIGILLIVYPLLYLIGLANSTNMNWAFRNIEIRASLFFFPIFIWLIHPSAKTIRKLLILFAFTTVLVALAGMAYRVYFYYNVIHDTGYFYNDNIIDIFGFQAVYYAIYVNFSIFILLHHLQDKFNFSRPFKVLMVSAIVLLIGFNFLLASRLSMLSLYLMLGIYLIVFIVKHKKYILGISLGLAAVLMFVGLITMFPKTLKRFDSIQQSSFSFENKNEINHFNGEIDEANWNGYTTRKAIWICAREVIKENVLIGVGHGDYKDALYDRYEEHNFYFGMKRKFGSHNMYLQNFIMFGIFGLIYFLCYLFIPFVKSIQKKHYLFTTFLVFNILAMLTEDVLAKNQGVVFFSFFFSLFVFSLIYPQEKKLVS